MRRLHHHRPCAVLVLLSCLMALSACSPDESFGRFSIEGIQEGMDACARDAFPIDMVLFGFMRRAESILLIMRTQGGEPHKSDHLVITVYAPTRVKVGEIMELESRLIDGLGVPLTTTHPARAEINIPKSCPRDGDTFLVKGQLVFDEFSEQEGGTIDGRFLNTQLINARTGAIQATTLEGTWDMIVRSGPPYEDFLYAKP